jgi:hypothetical protein
LPCAGTDEDFHPRPWACGTVYRIDSSFRLLEDLKAATYGLDVAMVDAS